MRDVQIDELTCRLLINGLIIPRSREFVYGKWLVAFTQNVKNETVTRNGVPRAKLDFVTNHDT